MQIPEKLLARLEKLGLSGDIYSKRTRKCILSKESLNLEKVPWYEYAYFIGDNFDQTKRSSSSASHTSGEFIFDPVSLLPCLALNPQKTDRILDMCAAPGTKTFIMSFLTENEAHITANDISAPRLKRLRGVVKKYGLSVEITNRSGRTLSGSFNKILLDAPCSGEGMVNKKEKAFAHWSEKRMKLLAKKQKKLLLHAFDLLEKGGTLVYSTCTFAPEENEAVIDTLLRKHPDAVLQHIGVKIKHAPGV